MQKDIERLKKAREEAERLASKGPASTQATPSADAMLASHAEKICLKGTTADAVTTITDLLSARGKDLNLTEAQSSAVKDALTVLQREKEKEEKKKAEEEKTETGNESQEVQMEEENNTSINSPKTANELFESFERIHSDN